MQQRTTTTPPLTVPPATPRSRPAQRQQLRSPAKIQRDTNLESAGLTTKWVSQEDYFWGIQELVDFGLRGGDKRQQLQYAENDTPLSSRASSLAEMPFEVFDCELTMTNSLADEEMEIVFFKEFDENGEKEQKEAVDKAFRDVMDASLSEPGGSLVDGLFDY